MLLLLFSGQVGGGYSPSEPTQPSEIHTISITEILNGSLVMGEMLHNSVGIRERVNGSVGLGESQRYTSSTSEN